MASFPTTQENITATSNYGLVMVTTQDKTIFDVEWFTRILHVERKRTDRSQRPFLLLLLELRILLRDGQQWRRSLVKNVIQSLQSCARQTDMIGWYKHNTVIGVIFTELRQEEPPIGTILERVNAALQARLTPEQIDAVTLSMHLYPHQEAGSSDAATHAKLYPDRTRKKLTYLLKRIVDVLGSFSLLVLLSPVFVCIGVAIKLTSPGPILFQQTRIGQFGQPFMFLKFRSMYTDADPRVHEQYIKEFILQSKNGSGAPDGLKQDGLFKLSKDPRITPLGHYLRSSSLDELPQLLNVLVGTMSLVGPRPPIPYEVKDYDLWYRRRVLEAKPGITGPWQVQGRSRTTFEEMVRLDLHYIDTWSLWTDFKLLLQTPLAVFKGAR
jgi:lipopolysaccharide/colanic/teichoic acid biosynthesis glycosyltransferase